MVAYWLGHPDYTGAFPASQVAQAAKDSITSLHWARVEGGYNVAYNGAHECVEDDGASSDGEGSDGSTTPTAKRDNMVLGARQDAAAGNTTLGLGGILAASCPLPPTSSSSSSVITATPTTFATVTSTASATATAAAVEPMYCYSFDPACYVSLILPASFLQWNAGFLVSTSLLTFCSSRVTAVQMSLVEPVALSTLASRVAGVVLVARRMSFLMVRSARCLLEWMMSVPRAIERQVFHDLGRIFPSHDFTLLMIHYIEWASCIYLLLQ